MNGNMVPATGVSIAFDVEVPMRDGVILRANVATPVGDGPWPALIERTPYGKDSSRASMYVDLPNLARAGFIAIYQDTRARGRSDGGTDFTPLANDGSDGEDTIAWAAALPGCNGDVCMRGASYQGATQMVVAAKGPEALRAFAPSMSPSTAQRSLLYRGGVIELEAAASWFLIVGGDTLMRRHADDPAALMAALGKLGSAFADMEGEGIGSLPLSRFPPLAQSGVGDVFLDMVNANPTGSQPMIKAMRDAQDYSGVTAPAFVIAAWYDYFLDGSIDQYRGIRARGGSAAAREQSRLIIGPWTHDFQNHINGERSFGVASSAYGLGPDGLAGQELDFFRQIMAGEAPNVAPVRLFVMGSNVWRDETEWPLAREARTPWYLSVDEHGEGALGETRNPAAALDYVYDPADPAPTLGGTTLGLLSLSGARDQRPLYVRDDILLYTSAPLAHDVEVTGHAEVELWIETDVVDSDFVVQLVDVQPDGTAWNVAEGIQRARYRDDPEMAGPGTPIEPGVPTLIRVALTPTSNVFKAGNRIRLQVSSSCFPRWARNLNIWDQLDATLADACEAHHRVLNDADHGSRIILPVIPPAMR